MVSKPEISKSKLAIELSRLRDFDEHILHLEQYSTPSEIAADIVWKAYMLGDIRNRAILDPACGPGFLGIGCLLLGAKKVIFLDVDKEVINILKDNLIRIKNKYSISQNKYEIINEDIKDINIKDRIQIIIQNPPFGTKQRHADKIFLEKAFQIADIIYSFHKIESKSFIEKISQDNKYKITHYWEYDFELKATQRFHKRRIHRIRAGCWRMVA